MSADFNRWFQSRLTAHGFAVGGIDGVVGPTTLKALRAFQVSRNLLATGTVTVETQAALRQSASAITPEQKVEIGNIDTPKAESELPSIVPQLWPRQSHVAMLFGNVGTDQVLLLAPYDMRLAWDLGTRVRNISVHRMIMPSVQAALERTASVYSPAERSQLGLDRFGGSLNVRRMRGGKAFSMHSWGIALDFDPERNGLTTKHPVARLSHPDAEEFWRAWIAQGALPLGKAIGRDWMHVQFARL